MKWTISEFEQGQRVVDFLKSKGVHPKIWRAIQAKNIPIINQSFFQSNYLLQLGDRIDISPAFFKSKAPTELKADILLETKNLLIVNKPANILVHPSGPQKETTLNDLVLAYYLSKSISSSPHPILRLDRNTSGIVVYAKSPSVQSQLQNAELHKTYLAVVDQNFPDTDFLYSAPIQRNEDSIIERKIGDLGKSSLTHFSVLAKTSSHTTQLGSAMRKSRAVKVQAHQPTSVLRAMIQPQVALSTHWLRKTKTAQAHSVPKVPGANGAKPAPKASAIQRAAWARMNGRSGRTAALAALPVG